ncbi:hypothetical protein AB4571_02655 [Vibrio breoganii]
MSRSSQLEKMKSIGQNLLEKTEAAIEKRGVPWCSNGAEVFFVKDRIKGYHSSEAVYCDREILYATLLLRSIPEPLPFYDVAQNYYGNWPMGNVLLPNDFHFNGVYAKFNGEDAGGQYHDFYLVLKSAYEAGFVRLIVELSYEIAQLTRMIWNDNPIQNVWFNAVRDLDPAVISKLDSDNRLAIFFLATSMGRQEAMPLAMSVLWTLDLSQFESWMLKNRDMEYRKYAEIISEHPNAWREMLTVKDTGNHQKLHDVFSYTIGRVFRNVEPGTAIYTSAVGRAIEVGVLDASYRTTRYGAPDGELSVFASMTQAEREGSLSFRNLHYLRLRAEPAITYIKLLGLHLQRMGCMNSELKASKQSMYVEGSTLHIIREFTWNEVWSYSDRIISGEINKITIYSCEWSDSDTPDEAVLLHEIDLHITEDSLAMIRMCYLSFTLREHEKRLCGFKKRGRFFDLVADRLPRQAYVPSDIGQVA